MSEQSDRGDHRSTVVEKIARRTLDRILEEVSWDIGGRDGEVLEIITQAIEAGRRMGIMLAFTHPTEAAVEMVGD